MQGVHTGGGGRVGEGGTVIYNNLAMDCCARQFSLARFECLGKSGFLRSLPRRTDSLMINLLWNLRML